MGDDFDCQREHALLKQRHSATLEDLKELKAEFKAFVAAQEEKNSATATQFAILNLKAAAWGALAGLIPAIAVLLLRSL